MSIFFKELRQRRLMRLRLGDQIQIVAGPLKLLLPNIEMTGAGSSKQRANLRILLDVVSWDSDCIKSWVIKELRKEHLASTRTRSLFIVF